MGKFKGAIVSPGNFTISAEDRHSVYTVWLRYIVLAGILIGTFILSFPSFLSSFYGPDLPWKEENRILREGKKLTKKPSAEQPQLTDTLRYKARVYQDGSPRGFVNFILYADGTLKGVWNGEFDKNEDIYCTILAASYYGNIDPTKQCIQNNMHDASKLYFITSGSYSMVEKQPSGQSRGINGMVYIRGWFDPNYEATGELFITQNRKTYEIFSFSADPFN